MNRSIDNVIARCTIPAITYSRRIGNLLQKLRFYSLPFCANDIYIQFGRFPFMKMYEHIYSFRGRYIIVKNRRASAHVFFDWIDSLKIPSHYRQNMKQDIKTVIIQNGTNGCDVDIIYEGILTYLTEYLKCLNNRKENGKL